MDPDGFLGEPSARAWFESVRGAAQDLARMERAVAKMRAREGLHAAQMGGGGKPGGVNDANAATDARMDYETFCAPSMDRCGALLDLAVEVLRGSDGSGGVSYLMGPTTASIVHMRYVKAMQWDEIARTVGLSPSRCRVRADAAMDLMDALGPGRVKDGDGCAVADA